MRYLFLLTFVFVFIFFDISIGYTHSSPLYTHLTYMFQHAGIMHLTVNTISFMAMFRVVQKCIASPVLTAIILLAAFACSFLAACSIPTVGASPMVYTMVGLVIGFVATRRLRFGNKSALRIFLLSIFLSLSVSALKHNSNFALHLYALAFGLLIAAARGKLKT